MGTEETTGCGTRGIYADDKGNGHMAQFDRTGGVSIERGWKFYDERPWLSGLFFWTGFDYRGEPNPLAWPAVSSQFGIIDACGFPKDQFYYLKAWWTNEPVLYIAPHWNWKGKEGLPISVWAYSNCDAVELFLDKKSLGRKPVPKNSHIEWDVPYQPGTLLAKGFKNGKQAITTSIETTGVPANIKLTVPHSAIKADGEDLSIVTIQVADSKGRMVPDANTEITFSISGPGKIIGVGNGNPSSHEPDKFIDKVAQVSIGDLRMKKIDALENLSAIMADNDEAWTLPFTQQKSFNEKNSDSLKLTVVRGTFTLDELTELTEVTLYPRSLANNQTVYVNGHKVFENLSRGDLTPECKLDRSYLKQGKNTYVIAGTPQKKKYEWDELNTDPGLIKVFTPSGTWKRRLFNGYAQVIVQAGKKTGEITLTASSSGLPAATLKINAVPSVLRPAVE